jgi:competence protein ComEC
VRVTTDGFVRANTSGDTVFEADYLKAFLINNENEGYKYNSLVFGTCDSRLINKFSKELTLRDAVIETKSVGTVDRPEKNEHFEALRNKFRYYFDNNHSGAASGILRGLVLGDKTGLSRKIKDQLVSTGTIHIMVASGFNVILLGGIVVAISKLFVGRIWAYQLSLLILMIYVFLTGFESPIIRAYLMYLVLIGGKLLGRGVRAVRSLVVAVLLMILMDPWIVWEVGFQLSVAATYGLVAFKPLFDRWMYTRIPERFLWLLETDLGTTFCAFLATTPILWWHFGRVQWVGLVTNLLIGPFVPILTTLGVLELVVGILRIPSGGMVSLGTEILSTIILRILYLFG